jgi:hypothetical protein
MVILGNEAGARKANVRVVDDLGFENRRSSGGCGPQILER